MMVVWSAGSLCAQIEEVAYVSTGGGAVGTNANLRHVFVLGESFADEGVRPGAIHWGGFLAAGVWRPQQDTDGDGLADEWDLDNDGDRLWDREELDGSAFQGFAVTDPMSADTDADGMNDLAEAMGMFDPLDPDHNLRITGFSLADTNKVLRYMTRGGGAAQYLMMRTNWTTGAAALLQHKNLTGGDPPWHKMERTLTLPPNAPEDQSGIFVEVEP